jgi:LTXXQ motif family protein
MLKPVIAATAALAIAGSSIVYAQQRFGGPGYGDGPRVEHWFHRTPDDMAALANARIAALKAGLALTPDQAKNWPAFEQALRDMAQLRIERRKAREAAMQQPPSEMTPFERLARRADNLAKTSAALKRIAGAGTPLYQSLNDVQKHRFRMLARLLRSHHHMHGRGDGGWRDHGFGQDGRRFGRQDRLPNASPPSEFGSADQGSEL